MNRRAVTSAVLFVGHPLLLAPVAHTVYAAGFERAT